MSEIDTGPTATTHAPKQTPTPSDRRFGAPAARQSAWRMLAAASRPVSQPIPATIVIDPFAPLPLDDEAARVDAWAAFLDVAFIGQMAAVLVFSVVLAYAIAYHPSTRHRTSTVDDFERPKVFILYALIGAVVALVVRVRPSRACRGCSR